jgi:hypothetical protein
LKRQSGQDWPDYTYQAIACSDSIDQDNVTTQAVFDEFERVVKNVSPMCKWPHCDPVSQDFSHILRPVGIQFPQPAHHCHRWAARSIERFTGPWNHTLKNPIIVIGNKADPATPFADASEVAGFLGDSAVLVEQDGFGHASLAQKSSCTQKIILDFFVNGVTPKGDDTICEIDADAPPLFPGKGPGASDIRNALSNNGNNNSGSSSQDLDSLKAQKKTLFIAVIALAAACGILLISLVVSCVTGRRGRGYKPLNSRSAHAQQVEFVGYDGDRPYSDPYDSRGSKD